MKYAIADKDTRRGYSLRAALPRSTAEVVVYNDGPAIIRDAAHLEGATVIVWMSLGQMGGFAVCKELDRLKGRPSRIVLVVERNADKWIAAQAGADEVIVCADGIEKVLAAL